MMKQRITTILIVGAFGAFGAHLAATSRWLVLHFARANGKTIPIDLGEAAWFFGAILVLACLGWSSRSVRTQRLRPMVASTGLNLVAFAFTGALLLTGVIGIIKH